METILQLVNNVTLTLWDLVLSRIHCDATVTTKDASHVSNRTHGTQSRWKTQQNIVEGTHDNLNIGSSSRFFYFLPHSASSLFKLLRHVK